MDQLDFGSSNRRKEASECVPGTSASQVLLVSVVGGEGGASTSSTQGDNGRSESVAFSRSRSVVEEYPRRKSRAGEGGGLGGRKPYPFALVLRLRVLQIVCGISAMVMGTVALIEERGTLNLGIGVPAGAATVLAAAASIHGSRGFGGYHPPSFSRRPVNSGSPASSDTNRALPRAFERVLAEPGRRWRHWKNLLSSMGHIAAALWVLAAGLCCTVVAKGIIALVKSPVSEHEEEEPWVKPHRTSTLAIVACVQLVLALAILSSAAVALHIRCFGDPDASVD